MSSIKILIYLVNFLLIIYLIGYQNKNYRSSVKWIIVFLLFPIFGFIIYLFIGKGIKIDKKRYQLIKERIDHKFPKLEKEKYKCLDSSLTQIINLNKVLGASNVSFKNDYRYYLTGEEYYEALLSEIEKAKRSIHIEVYIFQNDTFGKTLLDLLYKKATQGIKVKVLYDPNGNIFHHHKWLKKYKHENLLIIKQYNFLHQIRNFNYRNHRKIVVLDGKVAFLGGFNFGDEYLSLQDKVSPFRDTQLMMRGESVQILQRQFLIDFYYAYSFFSKFFDIDVSEEDVKKYECNKLLPMQIISTSYFTRENIKRIKLNILKSAKKEVYIQTPYFIPDQGTMEVLKLLILSGVKVNIMIPLKYDKKIPYCATLAYARELSMLGAKVYMYEGFIHSKVIIVDDYYLIVGSSNFDIRSASINLETDALIYSINEVKRFKNIFYLDVLDSLEYSTSLEEKLFKNLKVGKRIFLLISSLM